MKTDAAALVLRVQRGDAAAFEELYVRHLDLVSRIVGKSVRDRDMAADLVQETFFRALRKLPELRNPERFEAWLKSISRNVVADFHRHNGRVTLRDDDPDQWASASIEGPFDIVEARELARSVRGVVGGLSRRDATAIVLLAEFDASPAEIAVALDITVGAAKVVIHRARKRFRAAVELRQVALTLEQLAATSDAESTAVRRRSPVRARQDDAAVPRGAPASLPIEIEVEPFAVRYPAAG